MCATRAAELLAQRFGVPVAPDAVAELHRTGHIPYAGSYKGHPLYEGLALERLTDRAARDGLTTPPCLRSRTPLCVVLVEPELVAAIMVDTVLERGAWRHPVCFARLRLNVLAVTDVPPSGAGTEPAGG
ncbi:hypothetical protein [Streptomyces lavendofoliae]|uniref:hypothetical protein n=1 Tax=Streptomyces lavendofoliae TaxID=67314 RepID=UPI00300E767E